MIAGRYQVDAELGAGSTGRVYDAHDLTFDRQVAVKVLGVPEGPAAARFIREARLTAQLEHPGVVPVYDLQFLEGGSVAYAMRRIEGTTLETAIEQAAAGKPPACVASINAVVTVIIRLGEVLARAHDRGVLHRDVKPANVMIGRWGEVVLLDWGEALRADDPAPAGRSPVGTPAYMSPEQARGEMAEARSDVYGLGATLFHVLYGRPPLLGRNDPETYWRAKREGTIDPPVAERTWDVPAPLAAIVQKAIAADVSRRYVDAAALVGDLSAFQAGQAVAVYREGIVARLMCWHRRHARTFWTAMAALLAMAALAGRLWGERLREVAHWGQPVLVEDFVGWHERWLPVNGGLLRPEGPAFVSRSPSESAVLLRQELPPHSAIEYDAELPLDAEPGDVSPFWLEGDGVMAGANWGRCERSFRFQVGTWDHSCSIIWSQTGSVVAYSPVVPERGRKVRVRAEVDGHRLALSIDGKRIAEHREDLPLRAGRWCLYSYGERHRFSNIQVFRRGVAEKVGVLAVPDTLRILGHHRQAADEYGRAERSHPGTDLAAEAAYRRGLALRDCGDLAEAHETWNSLTPGPWADRAAAWRLADRTDGDLRRFCREFRAVWPGLGGEGRSVLLGLWMLRVTAFGRSDLALDEELFALLGDLRRDLFPDQRASDYPWYQAAVSAGHLRDVLPGIGNPWMRTMMLTASGRSADVLVERNVLQGQLFDALVAQGRVAEALALPRIAGDRRQAVLRITAGRPSDRGPVIGDLPAWYQARIERRTIEAVAHLYALPWSGIAREELRDWDSLAFGDPGWVVPARRLRAENLPAIWWWARMVGDARHRTWGERLASFEFDQRNHSDWFSAGLLPALGLVADGDRTGARRLLAVHVEAGPDRWGGLVWHAARFVRGEEDEKAFLSQPFAAYAQAMLPLVQAARAALDGSAAEAALAAGRWQQIPLSRRSIGHWLPNPAMERWAAWVRERPR